MIENKRTRLRPGDLVPPGLVGRVVLKRDNGPGLASEIEWFDAATIQTAGGWEVPETVNGYFYVLEVS